MEQNTLTWASIGCFLLFNMRNYRLTYQIIIKNAKILDCYWYFHVYILQLQDYLVSLHQTLRNLHGKSK